MTELAQVETVANARSGFSRTLRTFRDDANADVVVVGSHRKPEAVIVPFDRYARMSASAGLPVNLNPKGRASTALLRGVLDEIQEKRELVIRLAALNKIGAVAIFGSVARRQEGELSDIDFLVTPSTGATLFDLSQFGIDMEQLFSRSVDVVSSEGLDAERDAGILAEALPL
jgi:predicted nucleotidyltransferase/PHD/YefM family antitoxin component YafN of YafNO toxin-antitoxin module